MALLEQLSHIGLPLKRSRERGDVHASCSQSEKERIRGTVNSLNSPLAADAALRTALLCIRTSESQVSVPARPANSGSHEVARDI